MGERQITRLVGFFLRSHLIAFSSVSFIDFVTELTI